MRISFVETMSGTLTDEEGTERPVAFDVSAVSRGPAGHFELRGLMRAPPWAPETETSGTLVISPLKPALVYQLRFTARDGRTLTLDAQKTPSPLRPLTSMTFMPTVVREDGGRVLGRGSMRFDLRDLLPFLVSWLPGPRTQQKRLDARRRAVARQALQEG